MYFDGVGDDDEPNGIMDIHEFFASQGAFSSPIQLATNSGDIVELDIIPVGNGVRELVRDLVVVSTSSTGLRLFDPINFEFQSNLNFDESTWFAYDASRFFTDNICNGDGVPSRQISSLNSISLSQDVMVFGERLGAYYLFGIRANFPYSSLTDVGMSLNGSSVSGGLLNDSITMFLVPANTTGHLQTFRGENFTIPSCTFSLTSPPLIDF